MNGTYMYSDEYGELALDREHNAMPRPYAVHGTSRNIYMYVQQLTAITTNYLYNKITYNVKASISYRI